MSDLCFITTCRGRLSCLQQSLPTIVAQPGCSCVVVDYDCPERTADWIAATYPEVRVVHETGRPRFELSRARNLGGAVADAEWLVFIDADICLSPHFAAAVLPLLKKGHFYWPDPRPRETWGTCVCHRDDFVRIEGYDEVLLGWGAEDGDFYQRLKIIGTEQASFAGDLIQALSHDDTLRVAHHEVKDHWLNATANNIYCRAKWDLMRLWQKNLPLDMRRTIYDKFYNSILAAHDDGEPIQISFPYYRGETWSCGPLECRLVFTLPQPQGKGSPPE